MRGQLVFDALPRTVAEGDLLRVNCQVSRVTGDVSEESLQLWIGYQEVCSATISRNNDGTHKLLIDQLILVKRSMHNVNVSCIFTSSWGETQYGFHTIHISKSKYIVFNIFIYHN